MKFFLLTLFFIVSYCFYSINALAQSNDPEEQFDSAVETLVDIIEDQNNPYWGRLELRNEDGGISSFELKAFTRYYEFGDHENYLQFNNLEIFVRSVRNFRYYYKFFVEIPFSKIYSVQEVNSSEFYIVTEGDDIEVNQEFVRYRDEELVATTMETTKHYQSRIKVRISSWQQEHDEVKDLFTFIAQYNQQRDHSNSLEETWGDGW